MTCGPIIAESQKDDSGTSFQFVNHPSMVGSSATLPGQSPDSNATNQTEILKSQSQSDSVESNESGSLPSKSSSTIDSSGTGSTGMGQGDGLVFKSSNRHKTSKRKKDRSKLRKGKWTVSFLFLESTLRCIKSTFTYPRTFFCVSTGTTVA